MRVARTSVAYGLGIALASTAVAFAQRPVPVPIVGSPAAGQQPPSTPPSQPPPEAIQPPSMPPTAAHTSRKLDLMVKDGMVALDAQNVTLREILVEWQQKSGCQFVNADKLPATPVTVQFPAGTPELAVIDSLLHGLGSATTGYGYMVAARGPNDPSCRAVYILATSRPSASPAYSPSSVASPIAAPLVTSGNPDNEIPPVTPMPPPQPPQAYPQPASPRVPNPTMLPAGQNPPANQPPPQQNPTGFGPIAPTAPGAGRIGAPAGGRGGLE